MSDGCGYGTRPAKASKILCTAFTDYISKNLFRYNSIDQLSELLIDACVTANLSLFEGYDGKSFKNSLKLPSYLNLISLDVYDSATATFLGGFVVKLSNPTNNKCTHAVVTVSVGDLCLYHWSHHNNKLLLHCSDRNMKLDKRDPGIIFMNIICFNERDIKTLK